MKVPCSLFCIAAICYPLVIAPPASAADAKGFFALDGGGAAECKTFLEARKADDKRALNHFGGWLDGYISASNRYTADTYDLTPWQITDVLLLLVSRYCENYPNDRVGVAADNLILSLTPHRLTAQSSKIRAGSETRGVVLYREVMRRAQQGLKEQGFYTGPIDGNYGDAMKKAIIAFQEKNGLSASGLPDQEILFRLLPLDKPAGKQAN